MTGSRERDLDQRATSAQEVCDPLGFGGDRDRHSSEVEATTASCSSLVTVSSEQTARYSTSTAVAYRASEKACLGHVAPHDLRRTFVSAAVERGLDIESVRRLARHTAIRTTALYVGSESPVEELGADPVAGGFGG